MSDSSDVFLSLGEKKNGHRRLAGEGGGGLETERLRADNEVLNCAASVSFVLSDDSSSESECESDADGSTCSSSSDSDVFDVIAEIKRKKAHPDRLHEELWYNDPGQVSTNPSCAPNPTL